MMQILIDPSGQNLNNMGDLAMCQVAVDRIRGLWPDATIHVLTEAGERLKAYCPAAIPLPASARRSWCADGYLLGGLHRRVPKRISRRISLLERQLRRRHPGLVAGIQGWRARLAGGNGVSPDGFLQAVSRADLVVASGAGTITDSFGSAAAAVLDTLALAMRYGIPTAMLGQGLGPIQNRELLDRAKAVLPSVDLIALREPVTGMPLLESLGVERSRVLTTGDDTIELAYQARGEQPGAGIGVNLRVAPYSGVDWETVQAVGAVMRNAVSALQAPMIPVPIRRDPDDRSDVATLRQLLRECGDWVDPGQELDTPLKVIQQVGCCRLVVTGSYHAAVFALAQGIPVIGLVSSPYYAGKFQGLAHQFGEGCEIVRLDEPQLAERLLSAVHQAWHDGERRRSYLLDAAARQIAQSRAAYARLPKLVESGNAAT